MAKKENSESHSLIDGYLKKSWASKLWRFLVWSLVLAALVAAGLWLTWQYIPQEKRDELRESYSVVDRVASFFEERAWTPQDVKLLPRVSDEKAVKAERTFEPQPTLEVSETSVRNRNPAGERRALDPSVTPSENEPSEESHTKPAFTPEYDPRLAALEAERRERLAISEKILEEGGLTVSWRAWIPGENLTWDDFKSACMSKETMAKGASISSYIAVSYSKNGSMVFSYMVPEYSWRMPGLDSRELLGHEQLHFDITEVFARKLRQLLAGVRPEDFGRIQQHRREVLYQWGLAQRRYDDETHHGLRREKQEAWRANIDKALDLMADWQWVPYWGNPQADYMRNARFYLGQLYQRGGEGYESSLILAKKWYLRAHASGSSHAANNLGVFFQRGEAGFKPSMKKAFQYYKSAAANGDSTAQFNLGIMYWRGFGAEPSAERARDWFMKAADSNPFAREALKRLMGEEPVQSASSR